jgi:superfamily II DNA/RNA helicase
VVDEADTILDSGNIEIMAYLMRIVVNDQVVEERGAAARVLFVSATLNGTLNEFIDSLFSEKGKIIYICSQYLFFRYEKYP